MASARDKSTIESSASDAPSSMSPFPGAEALDTCPKQKPGGKASSSSSSSYSARHLNYTSATRPALLSASRSSTSNANAHANGVPSSRNAVQRQWKQSTPTPRSGEPPESLQTHRAKSEASGQVASGSMSGAPFGFAASTSQTSTMSGTHHRHLGASRGKPVSSFQARWWREFVWPQMGQELQMEVQLVEDKVRGLMQDSLAASARAEAAGSDGPNDGEQSGDLGFNGREASKAGDDDLGDREAHAEASAAALTDQVFDISFRHLLRRDPQFHTALRHSVNALDETRHDVDVATQMAFTAMINSQTWHHKLAMISESQADLQQENDCLRRELAKMKDLVSDMEDEILSSEYKSTKLGKALRADTEEKSLEERVDTLVSEMRRIKSCQTTLKRLLPSWRLYYGDETLHEFLDYEDSEKPSPSVMGALQQDVMYLASLLGVHRRR